MGAIQSNREPILNDRLNDLKSAVRRRDLISERELEDQAAEMLSTIVDVPAASNL